jgi:hypothetical protein
MQGRKERMQGRTTYLRNKKVGVCVLKSKQ